MKSLKKKLLCIALLAGFVTATSGCDWISDYIDPITNPPGTYL